jgi:hypothetical protein
VKNPESEADIRPESPQALNRLTRKVVVVFAAATLLFAAFEAVSTLRFVMKSEKRMGVISKREKVNFRSWKITVRYQEQTGAEKEFSATGYYDGEAYAPDSQIAVRSTHNGAKLADFGDLWLTSALALLISVLLFWLYFLLA